MPTRLTLEALEVLDAIERKGSFAAAAAALYKVPSALTYSVQKIEEDLGITLFVREGRRSVLTPAGRLLVEQGRQLLEAADRLVEQSRQVDSGWESRVNIAVDSVYGVEKLFPLVADLMLECPTIEINLYEEVLGGTWEAVAEGRADIAFGSTAPTLPYRQLELAEVATIEWAFMVAPSHPLARCSQPLSEEDIKQHRAVVVRDSSQHLPPLTRNLLDQQPVLSVATVQQKIAAQIAGLGCGYLPRGLVDGALSKGELVELATVAGDQQHALYAIWKRDATGRAVRWLASQLGCLDS